MHPACGEVHEIENAGRFPATLSPQRLTAEEASANDNTSLPPNPDIANVMFIGGLIEYWGRGLSMMNNKCRNIGLPKPQIKDNGYMVKVIFARPSAKDKRTVGEQLENSRRTVEEQLDSIPSSFRKLILAIGENWLTAQELRDKMGYKSRSSFWTNYLSPAIENGLIALENEERVSGILWRDALDAERFAYIFDVLGDTTIEIVNTDCFLFLSDSV